MAESRSDRQEKTVSTIKDEKRRNYNIKLGDDKYDCFISGIAITRDGMRLLADRYNNKVKMFSRNMRIKKSLPLTAKPWDIAVTGDKEAVVSVPDEPKLLILKVSKKKMKIKDTLELSFKVFGIATTGNELLVTSQFPTPSVKLIDQSGTVYWSTSTDDQGQNLFSRPEYVTCYDGGMSSTVIVTDFERSMFTQLNRDRGDVTGSGQVEKKVLCGVTTDSAGNMYMCYYETREVGVLSQEFPLENIVLTEHDGVGLCPQAIAYDTEDHQLLVSYSGNDFDRFQLLTHPWIKHLEKYNVKLRDDKDCGITCLAVTLDGRRLLADLENKKIKMFSRDMTIISFLFLPAKPWDIAVTGESEAIISVLDETKLYSLDVSDQQMSVRRTVELSFSVWGLATYKDKLVVTSLDPSPTSVKLIDLRGKVYWSASCDQQGQKLFYQPWYVSCYDGGRSSTVIVTDRRNHTLTMLSSDTGDVISRREVGRKSAAGVTTDNADNIYVCYRRSRELAVLCKGFSEEKILLTQRDGISLRPVAVVYDAEDHQLLVSYSRSSNSRNVVDCFQLLQ